jgi:hypothetical protein
MNFYMLDAKTAKIGARLLRRDSWNGKSSADFQKFDAFKKLGDRLVQANSRLSGDWSAETLACPRLGHKIPRAVDASHFGTLRPVLVLNQRQ